MTPAEAEEFDDHQSKAVDGYGGGTWAPLTRIVLGGAGTDFTGGTGADPLGPLTSTAAPGTGASGLVATGDGAGTGVVGVSGSTGFGGRFVGEIGGVYGQAAGGNNYGLGGLGSGSGAGVAGAGGSSSGPGGLFTGGGPNGEGVTATASGTGAGVTATGGGTSGFGLHGTGGGPNGVGVRGDGAGTAPGVVGSGGSSGGPGGNFVATGGNGRGLQAGGIGSGVGGYFTAGATALTPSIVGHSGPLVIDTDIPTPSTAPGANTLWASNIPKVAVFVETDGTGGITLYSGFGAVPSIVGNAVRLTFSQTPWVDNELIVVGGWRNGGASESGYVGQINESTTFVDCPCENGFAGTGSVLDASGNIVVMRIVVFGRQ